MYSLVPKKKTKMLKQRTVLEMFKELQQTAKSPEVCASHLFKKFAKLKESVTRIHLDSRGTSHTFIQSYASHALFSDNFS